MLYYGACFICKHMYSVDRCFFGFSLLPQAKREAKKIFDIVYTE